MGLRRAELWQLVVVIIVAGLFAITLRSHGSLGRDVDDSPILRSIRDDPASPRDANDAADLTLIVFTDYRCPACRVAHPAMKQAVRADGKVGVIYKEWPIFGEASRKAAQVALASRWQNIYPQVHDRLMSAPSLDDHNLQSAVQLSGGDWRRLKRDLANNQGQILAELERNRNEALALRLSGTPAFLVGPTLMEGVFTEREFKRAFKQARRRK